ncbi:MAG: MBL fold metallo-hydrolase [Verrucomicrobia bacterium]|nr:MBL fold metallo-hydrolase [Verrucomicrobiota bacterium]
MKITDLNPHGGIGANCTYAKIGPFQFAIDSGLHPKYAGNDSLPRHEKIPSGTLDFILLTHCHLDHLGSLPLLSNLHPQAPIFLSYPSSILIRRMLSNSLAVMKRQRSELNLPELPLYGRSDLSNLYDRMEVLPLEEPLIFEKAGEEIEITAYHAGHVAGALSFEVSYLGKRTFFTGDVLFHDLRTLDGAQLPSQPVDTLVMETTRGMSERPAGKKRESEIVRLLQDIRKCLKRGGSALIPVFALGRMQEMLVVLDEARKNKALPPTPVFCSGLGMDLVNHMHQISRNFNRIHFSRKVLRSLGAQPLPRKIKPGEPVPMQGIYLVSSGMLVEHTPSYMLASSMLGNDQDGLFFVGYCDPNTPGGQLLTCTHGDDFLFEAVDIQTKIRATVQQYDLSGHADRDELLAYAKALSPRKIVLHHGDPESRAWFAQQLEACNLPVLDPEPLLEYEV